MESNKLKADISKMLETIDDQRFLNSVLVMMEAFSRADTTLSMSQLEELETRIADHKAGRTENIPWRQSIDGIRKSLG